MTRDIVPTAPAGQLAEVERITARRDHYRAAARAAATLRIYQRDWRHFAAWCDRYRASALPAAPELVELYLADVADRLAVASITQYVSAIAWAHRTAGHESPTASPLVREALAGIRRAKGTAPAAKAALSLSDLRAIVAGLPDTTKGRRDRAILLVGFQSAFRRSELVGLDVEHVTFEPEGMRLLLPRSKTDQEGEGRTVGVPYGRDPRTCPVLALRAWIDAAGIASGPVFRPVDRHGNVGPGRLGDRVVAAVVKAGAEAVGRDPDEFAGHSLRAGFCTEASRAGCPEWQIRRQSGHRGSAMLLRYIRAGSLWTDNAAAAIDL
jgi:integrase